MKQAYHFTAHFFDGTRNRYVGAHSNLFVELKETDKSL